MRRTILASAVLLAGCVQGRAYLGYGSLDVDGQLSAGTSGADLGGVRNDVTGSLGTDATGSFYARADLSARDFDDARTIGEAPLNWSLSAFTHDDSGSSSTLQNSFGSLPAGAVVDSTVEARMARLSATVDVMRTGTFDAMLGEGVGARFGLGVGAGFVDVNLGARAPGDATRLDTTDLLPMLVAQAELNYHRLTLLLDSGWGAVPDRGSVFDLEGLVSVHWHGFQLFTGYRYVGYDTTGSDRDLFYDSDLEIRGWLVGAGFRF